MAAQLRRLVLEAGYTTARSIIRAERGPRHAPPDLPGFTRLMLGDGAMP